MTQNFPHSVLPTNTIEGATTHLFHIINTYSTISLVFVNFHRFTVYTSDQPVFHPPRREVGSNRGPFASQSGVLATRLRRKDLSETLILLCGVGRENKNMQAISEKGPRPRDRDGDGRKVLRKEMEAYARRLENYKDNFNNEKRNSDGKGRPEQDKNRKIKQMDGKLRYDS